MKKTATVLFAQVIILGLLPVSALAETFRLEEATVSDINAAFDAGALSSERLTQLYLNRIETYDQGGLELNSVLTLNPNALETAASLDLERQITGPRGPLHGIPILLKDNIDTFDLPTTAGSLALKGSIPPDDAFITQKLRDSGAIILGKVNLSEFAGFLSIGTPAGYSSIGGYVFNPYNPVPLEGSDGRPALTPGGSSAGSGVAAAANLATFTIGTDTAGSILSPANANSVVGIRPTLGLVSRDGIIPIASSRDTAGPLARSVTDAAITLGPITGVDPSDSATSDSIGKSYSDYTQFLKTDGLQGARIGVPRDFYWDTLTDEQKALTEKAIGDMERLGATIIYEDIPTARETALVFNDIIPVLSYEFKRDLNAYLGNLDPDAPIKSLADIIAFNNANPEAALKYGQRLLLGSESIDLETDMLKYLEDRATALRLAREEGLDFLINGNDLDAVLFPAFGGSSLTAQAGYPGISIPAGYLTNGDPFNISLTGTAFSEPTLIGLAYAYEQGTLNRLPPGSTPPLPGEVFEYEPVPEPSTTIGLTVFGLTALGLKLKQRRKI